MILFILLGTIFNTILLLYLVTLLTEYFDNKKGK